MLLYKARTTSNEAIYRDKTTKQPMELLEAANYIAEPIGTNVDVHEFENIQEAVAFFNLEEIV
jgi:hypothetical protein